MDDDDLFYHRTSLSKTHNWTDDMVKNSYQAFSVHYLIEDFRLNSTCLGVYEFTKSKMATKAKTSKIMRNLLPLTLNVVYVIDNAANIKAAYKNDLRINLVVTTALKSKSASPVNEMISTAKSVVRYLKYSGCNKDLDHTLKQDVSTRWNSQFFMLQSLSGVIENMTTILENEKQYEKLENLQNVDKNLLKDIIAFQQPFHNATVQLLCDTKPNFHRVWLTL